MKFIFLGGDGGGGGAGGFCSDSEEAPAGMGAEDLSGVVSADTAPAMVLGGVVGGAAGEGGFNVPLLSEPKIVASA